MTNHPNFDPNHPADPVEDFELFHIDDYRKRPTVLLAPPTEERPTEDFQTEFLRECMRFYGAALAVASVGGMMMYVGLYLASSAGLH